MKIFWLVALLLGSTDFAYAQQQLAPAGVATPGRISTANGTNGTSQGKSGTSFADPYAPGGAYAPYRDVPGRSGGRSLSTGGSNNGGSGMPGLSMSHHHSAGGAGGLAAAASMQGRHGSSHGMGAGHCQSSGNDLAGKARSLLQAGGSTRSSSRLATQGAPSMSSSGGGSSLAGGCGSSAARMSAGAGATQR